MSEINLYFSITTRAVLYGWWSIRCSQCQLVTLLLRLSAVSGFSLSLELLVSELMWTWIFAPQITSFFEIQDHFLWNVPYICIGIQNDFFSQISKVKTKECSIYEGCSQCLGARDPYCGWCSSENKCSLRRDCREAFQDPRFWLNYKTDRCAITRVKPDKIQRTTTRTVS